MKSRTKTEQLLNLAKQEGVLRSRDLAKWRIPRSYLARLVQRGHLVRVGRGLYKLSDADVTEHYTLAQVCKRFPKSVVCLLSALNFYGLTTQLPHEIWIAYPRNKWYPKIEGIPLRITRLSGQSFTDGVEEKKIDGVPMQIYNPAKTVADCFKFRNKVGLDVAIEALRDCRRRRMGTIDEIWRYAKVDRAANVMRPYLESLA